MFSSRNKKNYLRIILKKKINPSYLELCSQKKNVLQVRELEGLLGRNSTTQIIWTSSLSAHKDAFSIDNIQHVNG